MGLEPGDPLAFPVTTAGKQGTGEVLNVEGHLKSAKTGEWEPGGQGPLSHLQGLTHGRSRLGASLPSPHMLF